MEELELVKVAFRASKYFQRLPKGKRDCIGFDKYGDRYRIKTGCGIYIGTIELKEDGAHLYTDAWDGDDPIEVLEETIPKTSYQTDEYPSKSASSQNQSVRL